MSTHEIVSDRVATPLCDATHKIRGKLLVGSSTGIVIFHTGLLPKKIDGLGIEFTPGQQSAIVWCLLGLVVFLFVSYLISAAADVVTVRLHRKGRIENAMLATLSEAVEKTTEGNGKADAWYLAKQAISNTLTQLHVPLKLVSFISHTRFAWDAILPIFVTLYSIGALITLLCHAAAR